MRGGAQSNHNRDKIWHCRALSSQLWAVALAGHPRGPNATHRLLVAVLTLLATADLQPAEALEKRVALVIGMSDYQHLGSLNNPVAAALRRTVF